MDERRLMQLTGNIPPLYPKFLHQRLLLSRDCRAHRHGHCLGGLEEDFRQRCQNGTVGRFHLCRWCAHSSSNGAWLVHRHQRGPGDLYLRGSWRE